MITITAGKFYKKKINTAQNIRPTKSLIRESIFNMIQHYAGETKIQDSIFLDLFSGTGIMSFEALSRGAAKAVAVDMNTRVIKKNAAIFPECNIEIIKTNIHAFNYDSQFDIIFLDPPYQKNEISRTVQLLINRELVKKHSFIIIESHISEKFVMNPYIYHLVKKKIYGRMCVCVIRVL